MARPISDEELQLKKRARRRLVGAIVLVTAVAVILPMVLDSEPRPVTQNVDIQIPSPDSGAFKPKAGASAAATAAPPVASPRTAVGPEVAGTPIKGMPPAVAAKEAPKAEAPAAVAEKEKASEAARDATKAASRDTSGEASSGAYVVQVAALADAARVKQLQKQMTAAGVKTYTEAVTTKTGEITRVRAGPYATREAAESARDALKKAGLDGKVVAR
jgi:DedD protein